ncbi:ABC transporter ATP-binding protein [Miniphocaeibacter halophilus]|uniref:Sn-glycerol-3-phosphate ABC transporter ATP-binding protein UgpC n=1 Tax=Miniphocaeibacter halophilus TaxID=2931922 RepID=A0AC61MNW5_9FIRM|nr:sn-glycerol-3-phosphate ABC transporter ATP-binding protein UgpC [Miniphocaeibacter halophilus]QQK07179.1 sn-glycerol-3-phosphate ABC transporter ATP-binding protein UgpC [Miniphocaeibacter halophilus]
MKVTLKNIGKKYEGREDFTIRNIDLDIESHDFCVILGPSGCGKSTLLRMVAGLNSITEGELLFNGRLMNKVASKDRDIAMVFQSYALYPHMTVYDNMAFSLAMRKTSKKTIHDRVTEAAKVLQIEDYLYSKPSDISGGQRQRVALGRAMVRKPAVFLMDEPLSNLDAKLREHMRIELVKLHKQLETTSIYVTHDQTEAMTMATKIVLLDKGVVQQVGKPDEFYDRPNNLFVAQFIGSPTMNVIEGKFINGQFESLSGEVKFEPLDEEKNRFVDYANKNITIGIRSERFEIKDKLEKGCFTGKIEVVENLGKEKVLYVKLKDSKEIVMTMPGYLSFSEGEEKIFKFDPKAVHYFDTETGLRI